MTCSSRLTAPVVLAVLTWGAAAHADPSDLERARALYDEAGELEKQGQWAAAQDRLHAALRIRETPHLRYALGWALENSDRLLEARTEYEVALRLAQRGGIDEVSRLAATRIAEVDRKTPLVQVRVRGALAKDSHVFVDNREVIVHGDVGAMPVDPGTRTIRVDRGGKTSSEEAVSVQPGVFKVVEIQGDESAAAPDPRGRGGNVGTGSRMVPWVFVGGGSALALGSILLFVSSSSDVSTRDQRMRQWCDATSCVGTTATKPESEDATALRRDAYDAAERGNTKQIIGAVMGGVGVAGIAVGTYMLLKTKRSDDDVPRAARLQVQAAPLAGGGIAGASFAF